MPKKTYVSARFETDELGVITPLWITFCKKKHGIDRIIDVRLAASAAGGHGTRYTVRIGKHQTYLFLDSFNRWFVEEKTAEMPGLEEGR